MAEDAPEGGGGEGNAQGASIAVRSAPGKPETDNSLPLAAAGTQPWSDTPGFRNPRRQVPEGPLELAATSSARSLAQPSSTRAGTPLARAPAGTSRFTTEPAPV